MANCLDTCTGIGTTILVIPDPVADPEMIFSKFISKSSRHSTFLGRTLQLKLNWQQPMTSWLVEGFVSQNTGVFQKKKLGFFQALRPLENYEKN